MRHYRILEILAVVTFVYLRHSACADYGRPVKCTKLDHCCLQNYTSCFKNVDAFEGVYTVNTEIHGAGMLWPYGSVQKQQKEKVDKAVRGRQMEQLSRIEVQSTVHKKGNENSGRKMAAKKDQFRHVNEQNRGVLKILLGYVIESKRLEFEYAEMLKREKDKLSRNLKSEIAALEDDSSPTPETKFDSHSKPSDAPFQPEPQLQADTSFDAESNLPSAHLQMQLDSKSEVSGTIHKKGNAGVGRKMTMPAGAKENMGGYRQVKDRKQKLFKMLLKFVSEMAELADGPMPENVVENVNNKQKSMDEPEIVYGSQYGLCGNGNTSVSGNGSAERPPDGNDITEFSPRADLYMYPSQDEPPFDHSLLPLDPRSMERLHDNPVIIIAGALARIRVTVHRILCSPITGPFILITSVVSIVMWIAIAVL